MIEKIRKTMKEIRNLAGVKISKLHIPKHFKMSIRIPKLHILKRFKMSMRIPKLRISKYFKWSFDISIRHKILLVVIMSVLIPMVFSIYISERIVSQKIEDEWNTRLLNSLNSAKYYFEDYQQKAKDSATILSSFSELRTYTIESNNLKASQFLVQLTSELGLDFVLIADQNKKLIARTDQPSKYGDDLSNDFMVKSGLAGLKAVSIETMDKAIYIQSAAPIKSDISATGVTTIGTVVTQYNIDKRFLEYVKKLNGLETTLYIKDNIISTLLDEKDSKYKDIKASLKVDGDIESKLLKGKETQFETKRVNNKPYYIAYSSLRDRKGEVVGLLSVAVAQDSIIKAKADMKLYFGIVIFIGLVVGVVSAVVISRKVVNPINRLVADTKRIAHGDLTYMSKIESNDEIGQLSKEFNNMATSLKLLVSQVINTVDHTSASSVQLTKYIDEVEVIAKKIEVSSEQIKIGSQSQSTYLKETKKDLGIVLNSALDISKQTNEMANYTNKAKQFVEKEALALKELDGNMLHTKETILNMSGRIELFKGNLKQIKGAIEIITSIADKTKLLALNAAIEAARAGDSGRGFGVVAAEIRKLSDESNSSVKDISQVIKSLFIEMNATAEVAEKSVVQFEASSNIVSEIENSFSQIVQAINRINNMIEDISKKSQLQSSNTENINSFMNDISSIVMDSFTESQLLHQGSQDQTQNLIKVSEELVGLLADIEKVHSTVKQFHI